MVSTTAQMSRKSVKSVFIRTYYLYTHAPSSADVVTCCRHHQKRSRKFPLEVTQSISHDDLSSPKAPLSVSFVLRSTNSRYALHNAKPTDWLALLGTGSVWTSFVLSVLLCPKPNFSFAISFQSLTVSPSVYSLSQTFPFP